jgi:probable selenium-dependent hydroxylase accessory protein YqeC
MGALIEALGLAEGGVIALTGAGGKTSMMYRLAGELSSASETVLTTTTTRIYPPEASQSPGLILAGTAAAVVGQAAEPLRIHRHLTAVAGRSEGDGKLIGFSPAVIDALAESGLCRWIVVEADGAAGRPLKAPADHEPVIPASARWVIAIAGLSAIGQPMTPQWVHRPERFSTLTGLPPGNDITPTAVARLFAHPLGPLKGAPPGSRRVIFLNQADGPATLAAGEKIAALLRRKRPSGCERVLIGRMLPAPAVIACHDLATT